MKHFFLTHGLPVADEDIKNFGDGSGLKLPIEYINFIKNINGGVTKNSFFDLRKFDPKAINANIYIKVEEFFEFKELNQIWDYTNELLNDDALFPIAEARGGMLICCKQLNTINAKIFYYDSDFGVLPLTESLLEFFGLLIEESEVDYKKYGIDI